jgi:uridine kinase
MQLLRQIVRCPSADMLRDTMGRWVRASRRAVSFHSKAHVMFNSLVYELAALALAEPLLRQVPHGVPEYIEAKRLLAFLEWFLPIEQR